ncbi:12344_t:CDS:2 [Funneliformis geosporum]|uniref:12344_t:CDS:1 n=1 Tax=Funneliformis geosporum TaxID=1117311 RepID=A0A9W4SLG8_9GLOM|nr:12344_t:CDS:2 [Funneliformis geosporum]
MKLKEEEGDEDKSQYECKMSNIDCNSKGYLFQGMIVLRGTKPPEIRKRAIIFEELIKEKLESW